MIACSFHDSHRARISDAESLSSYASHEHLTTRGSVEANVAYDDVFLCLEGRPLGGGYYDVASAQPLAAVVVCVTLQVDTDSLGHKCTKRLPRRTLDLERYRTIAAGGGAEGSGVLPKRLAHLIRQDRAQRPVQVIDGHLDHDRGSGLAESVDSISKARRVERYALAHGR